jgi:hypothetical protein
MASAQIQSNDSVHALEGGPGRDGRVRFHRPMVFAIDLPEMTGP